jgi:hypothetical protein
MPKISPKLSIKKISMVSGDSGLPIKTLPPLKEISGPIIKNNLKENNPISVISPGFSKTVPLMITFLNFVPLFKASNLFLNFAPVKDLKPQILSKAEPPLYPKDLHKNNGSNSKPITWEIVKIFSKIVG